MRRLTLSVLTVAGLLLPGAAAAQSSQFGVRGLGLPGRALSARAFALGGSIGLFDGESAANPAAITHLNFFTASFTGAQNWRRSTNPFGESTAKDNRFPQIFAAGPAGNGFAVGVSVGAYTDRSWVLASQDTISISGESIAVFDTNFSRGGVSDIRLAGAYRLGSRVAVGLGLHVMAGSTRLESRRSFSDSTFVPAIARSELSFAGAGLSVGFHAGLGNRVELAGLLRTDTKLNLDNDTTRVAETDLPVTVAGAIQVRPSDRITLSGQGRWRGWSSANEDLLAQGGLGSRDSWEVAGGLEIVNPRAPFRRPIRLGARYGTLPFPQETGQEAKEYGVSVGSGVRFTRGRGGVDVALERVWRNDGAAFTEKAWLLTVGVSLRP